MTNTVQSVPTYLERIFAGTIVQTDSGRTVVFNEPEMLSEFLGKCKPDETLSIRIVTKKPRRSSRQNRALHEFLTQLAQALNDAGLNMLIVLAQKMDIDWNPATVKEILWRSAQKAITRKKSTTELNRGEEITLIYDHLVRHLGEKFSLEVPTFPSYENEKEHIKATT